MSESSTITVYVSIGNSDDKLTQDDWCHYCAAVMTLVRMQTPTIHGEWYSKPNAPWQNAAICFEINPDQADTIKQNLRIIAAEHCQDSIAWAIAETEFLTPDPSVKSFYATPIGHAQHQLDAIAALEVHGGEFVDAAELYKILGRPIPDPIDHAANIRAKYASEDGPA